MNVVAQTCAAIEPVSVAMARRMQHILDDKTKPRGSLGMLESLACRLAAIYGRCDPPVPAKAVLVMAADHGVTDEGVSAYPAEVTAQMVLNFARGGAAINVLARQAGARVIVVNMGTRQPVLAAEPASSTGPVPCRLIDARIGPGTANFARGPAMTVEQAQAALAAGIHLASELCATGIGLLGVGEMGIGNTTAASALTAVFTGSPPQRVTGRGTGIDDAAWQRKVAVIDRALDLHRPRRDRPLETLACVGGFELAALAGVMLGAAAHKVPVMLDGFITGAAALVAHGICPQVCAYLIAAHQSVEPGHRLILEHLDLRPLLNLDLRLGEGTGAVLAMHLVDAALRIVHDMATFTSAGVTSSGA